MCLWKKIIITILTSISFFASWLVISLLAFGTNFVSLSLVGDDEIYLNVHEKYFENGYKSSFLFSDVDDSVEIIGTVDYKNVGTYEITYSLDWLLGKDKKIRKIHVVDEEAPVIKLLGDTTIYLNLKQKYIESGYAVYDNVDKNLAKSVKIESNLDNTKIGKYEIKYSVEDNSGNSTTATRSVEVIRGNLLSSPPEAFWLTDVYQDIILTPSETEYDYLKEATLLGDSNIRYLYVHGKYLNGNQVWGKDNLNAVELTTANIIVHDDNSEMLVDDALSKYQPKYLIASFGFGSVLNLSKNSFITYAEKFIQNIVTNYQNTKLIVVSLPPIATDTMYAKFQNKTNQFNYYLLELCAKYRIGFINVADELKGEDGYGNPDYFTCSSEYDCGFHLNKKGKELYINHLKKIDIKKEME